ncbi:uncharacterized protein [Primulina eburnea]|uniref:uncharacterized protein isoform X2 n=1 Tax=Primulina eburnea TaxID=1245227 RepID=UPI003C6C84F9
MRFCFSQIWISWLIGGQKGDRLDLATIRARKAATERQSPFAGNNRVHGERGAHVSHDNGRRGMSSALPEAVRGSDLQVSKKTTSSLSNKVSDSRVANVEGGEARKRIPEEVRKKTGDEEIRYPKKTRVEVLGATSKNSRNKHIFVDGVNHKEKADSFWDLSDPEIGWKKGRSIVGDFDMLQLFVCKNLFFQNMVSEPSHNQFSAPFPNLVTINLCSV